MKLQHIKLEQLSIVLFAAIALLTLPTVSAAQEKIAFSSDRDGNNEIYVMDADGANQTRLTDNSSSDLEPSFSADGSRIVFTSFRDGNAEIYVMNADGSNQTRLTFNATNDSQPSFVAGRAGNRIVFTSTRDGNTEIYVMNDSGSNQTNLTNNSSSDAQPSFSADGNRVAFASNRDGNFEIYAMDSDGANQTRLTNHPATDSFPAFRADGGKIAFACNRNINTDVCVMDADGANQTNLTAASSSNETQPSFSADGNRVAFATNRDGNNEIYVMNADGANQTRLTDDAAADSNPSFGGVPLTAPDLNNVTATSPVNENGLVTLSGTISDPNAGETFTLTVDWGDGTTPQTFNLPAGTPGFDVFHQYADDNPTATPADNHTISLTLFDSNGGSDADSTIVTVNNVAPVLSNLALNPSPVAAGETTALSGSVSDAGAQDSQTIVVNWGDDSPATTLNLAAGVSSFNAGHQYAAAGVFTITVTATDDDGGTDGETISITVNDAPNAPTNLRVDYVGANQVNLRWTDNSNNENGFVIEQCRSRNCNSFVEVGQVGANATTFLDTGLLANTQYIYRVRAFNAVGNSAYSNTVTAKTLRR